MESTLQEGLRAMGYNTTEDDAPSHEGELSSQSRRTAQEGALDMAAAVRAVLDEKLDRDGWRAVHVARQHPGAVRWLAERRADLRARKEVDSEMALHRAAWRGEVEAVSVLLECGAGGIEGQARDKWGKKPLFRACEKGHKECAELILEDVFKDQHSLPDLGMDYLGRNALYFGVGLLEDLGWLRGGIAGGDNSCELWKEVVESQLEKGELVNAVGERNRCWLLSNVVSNTKKVAWHMYGRKIPLVEVDVH